MPQSVPAPQDVSIRQLQYVIAVADTLGFHKAAQRCHVSQPTLSAQIQQLENVLGVQLFERSSRRVLLTAAGEQFVAGARRVLLELEQLMATLSEARDPLCGTLRMGIIPTIASYLLADVMPEVSRNFPQLRLILQEDRTANLVRDINEGRLDLGLVAMEAELGDCERIAIATDGFVAALPTGHPLTRKRMLRLDDLQDENVLLLEDGHCFRSQALALCASAGAVEADFRATSLATLTQMVSAGLGITLLPELAVDVENRRSQLEIRRFVAPIPSRTLGLVWRRGSVLAGCARRLAPVLAPKPHQAS